MKKNILISLFVFLILIQFAYSQEVMIEKSAPQNIKFGSNLNVEIKIINNKDSAIDILVEEIVAGAEPIDPPQFESEILGREGRIAARPPYYKWELHIGANSDKTVSYTIKPLNPGFFSLASTIGYVGDMEYESNTLSVIVNCNQNKQCESDLLENYQNCPEDCPSGSPDSVCDLIIDGVCDSDCVEDVDLDCKCGDGICQQFENDKICSKDCRTIPRYIVISGFVLAGLVVFFLIMYFLYLKSRKREVE